MASPESSLGNTTSPRYGRHGPRSKNGCNTCRIRKVKCDETRDVCNRCAKAQIQCDWTRPERNRRLGAKNRSQSTTSTPVRDDLVSSTTNDKASTSGNSPHKPRSTVSTSTSVTHGSPLSSRNRYMSGRADSIDSVTFSPDGFFLSPEDLESFEYIPRSFMVLRFGKRWRWSMLSYVHSTVARREQGVMRAFVAVASMELRSRELNKLGDITLSPTSADKARTFRDNASNSLYLAMQDLSSLLDRVALQPNNAELLEALFTMWFLILNFGVYDSQLVDMSYMHLDGIRSFIAEYFLGSHAKRIHRLPPASKQLLIYICHMDVMLALGSMGGGRLSLELVSAPSDSPVAYSRLFEEARVCVPQLWGKSYPVEELLDDIENYRPLRFLSICQMLKLKVWELGISARSYPVDAEDMESMWSKIKILEEEYIDILLLARQVSNTNAKRVIWTVYHASLDYYGLIILYSCIDSPDSVPDWLQESLTELLAIAHKALQEDAEHVYRYAWALQMALFKVKDPIHKDWLQAQIKKASVLLSNLGIPSQQPEGVSLREILFSEPRGTTSV